MGLQSFSCASIYFFSHSKLILFFVFYLLCDCYCNLIYVWFFHNCNCFWVNVLHTRTANVFLLKRKNNCNLIHGWFFQNCDFFGVNVLHTNRANVFGWMCYLRSEPKVVVFWLKRENTSSLICYRALIIFILWVEIYIYWNFKFEYNLEFGKFYFLELEKYIYMEWGRLECHLWCMETNESSKSSSTRQIASSLL